MVSNAFRIFLLVLGMCLGIAAACGQGATPQVVHMEYRYRFALNGELSEGTEKLLVESMLGFDPTMKVSIDRPSQRMKVLAYVPVDPQAIVSLASQFGVSLSTRRVLTDHEGNYLIQE